VPLHRLQPQPTRSHQSTLFEGVSNSDLLVSLEESIDEVFDYALVDDETSCGSASLASGSNGTEEDGSQSEVQIGIR